MRVRMPDGTIIDNVPDGTTQEDLLAQYEQHQQGSRMESAGQQVAAKYSPTESALVAAGKTFARLGQGAQDLYYRATGNDVAQQALKADVQEQDRAYKGLSEANPKATFLGELAPYLAIPGGPLASAAVSGLEYGAPEERAARAGFSYAGGKLLQGAARLFGPKTMSTAAADAGNKWGIPTTVGQNGGKMAQIIESVLANLPLSSGVVNKARDRTFGEFNRAIANTFGEDSTKLSSQLLGDARSRIGGEIGAIAQRSTLNVDPQMAQGIAAVSQRAQNQLVGKDRKLVNLWVDNIVKEIDPQTGQIPGTVYKALQSNINTAQRTGKGTVVDVLSDLRDTLRGGMDRSIPAADSEAWAKANKQYFNLLQAADAAKQTPGSVTPAQLLMSVNRSQRASKFGGGNDLAELARWAKGKLPDNIPNSGTAQRLFMQKLLTNPASTVGGLLGLDYVNEKAGLGLPSEVLAGAAIPYVVARGMAGKPASALARKLLERSGGLLGPAIY